MCVGGGAWGARAWGAQQTSLMSRRRGVENAAGRAVSRATHRARTDSSALRAASYSSLWSGGGRRVEGTGDFRGGGVIVGAGDCGRCGADGTWAMRRAGGGGRERAEQRRIAGVSRVHGSWGGQVNPSRRRCHHRHRRHRYRHRHCH